MMKFFPHITIVVWVAALLSVYYLPMIGSTVLVLVSSLVLLGERWLYFNSTGAFAVRVRALLADQLADVHARLAQMERGVEDVREAQIKIGGAFRGGGIRS